MPAGAARDALVPMLGDCTACAQVLGGRAAVLAAALLNRAAGPAVPPFFG